MVDIDAFSLGEYLIAPVEKAQNVPLAPKDPAGGEKSSKNLICSTIINSYEKGRYLALDKKRFLAKFEAPWRRNPGMNQESRSKPSPGHIGSTRLAPCG
jgi:hypothetical protein